VASVGKNLTGCQPKPFSTGARTVDVDQADSKLVCQSAGTTTIRFVARGAVQVCALSNPFTPLTTFT
jgi:hypothetical protein